MHQLREVWLNKCIACSGFQFVEVKLTVCDLSLQIRKLISCYTDGSISLSRCVVPNVASSNSLILHGSLCLRQCPQFSFQSEWSRTCWIDHRWNVVAFYAMINSAMHHSSWIYTLYNDQFYMHVALFEVAFCTVINHFVCITHGWNCILYNDQSYCAYHSVYEILANA